MINHQHVTCTITSIVKIRENSVMSWDQGFDAAGIQVWGAEKGGYRFEKTTTM